MAKFCSKCGAPLNGGNFCSECGAKAEDNPIQAKENKQIYEKTWFIILLLIFFFPVGLFLMWKYSQWNKAVKIIVTILVGLMVVFTVVSDNSENNDIGESDSSISVGSNDSSTQPVKTVSKSVQLLMDEGLSEAEANVIMSDLNSVGIKELISLKKGSGEGVDKLQAYAFSSESVSGLLTIENRKTYYIGTGNIDLFDSTKGGKLDDVTRYIISESEKYTFMSDAENYVKQGLKAPSTADFPSKVLSGDWKVNRKDDVVTVSAYVDAQNSFGAMIRSNFIVQISYSTSSCLYLEIDGQVMYGTYHK